MINAGLYDTRITILKKQVTIEPIYGREVVEWVPLVAEAGSPTTAKKFWAQVQENLPSKNESVQQGLVLDTNQSRVRMRHRTDIDSSMRVIVHYETDLTHEIIGGPTRIGGRQGMLEMVIQRTSS